MVPRVGELVLIPIVSREAQPKDIRVLMVLQMTDMSLQAVAEELGVPGHEDFMVRMATVGLHPHRLVEMEASV